MLYLAKDGSKQTAQEFFKLNAAGASTLTAEEQRDLYTYIGSGDPLWTGGFINNFSYRDFDLTVSFAFNLGMYTRIQPSYSNTYFDRGMNTNRDILDRWTSSNPTGSLPALMPEDTTSPVYSYYAQYGNAYSMLDTWVKKSDYFRLQSLRLAYNIPERAQAPAHEHPHRGFRGKKPLGVRFKLQKLPRPRDHGQPLRPAHPQDLYIQS